MSLFSTLPLSFLRTFASDSLDESSFAWYDSTFVTPYILAESHHTVNVFSLSPLANLSRNKAELFLLAPSFHFFFSSAQCSYNVKTFLYHGYYNKHTQRYLHYTNIITIVNSLAILVFFWATLAAN